MKNKLSFKLIIIAVLFLIIIGAYFLIKLLINDNENSEEIYLKNYEVNEYIPTYISDQTMAEIYLNDYINNMFYNVEKAYNLLNEEYRNKKFGSLQNYKNYVNNLKFSKFKISRYYKKSVDEYLIFGVYDQNGNFFAFKTNGVMQYTVYLDENTVEIW